jgi:hypothetical protein
MIDENDHSACVNEWLERAHGLPPERLLRAFDVAFGSVWRRAHITLGDVTLTAIVDRVLHTASEQYPVLGTLRVDATGLRPDELYQRAEDLDLDQLAAGIRFVLLELLTVLGHLTAEILTPALQSELSRVSVAGENPAGQGSQGEPGSRSDDGEKVMP